MVHKAAKQLILPRGKDENAAKFPKIKTLEQSIKLYCFHV